MDIIERLSEELGIKRSQIEAAVGLIDDGNTIPQGSDRLARR